MNPLESLPEACHKDERKFHVKPVRQKWFGCACCPPNLARLLSSIASYAYTEAEDALYVHLYMGSVLEKDCGGKSWISVFHPISPGTERLWQKSMRKNRLPAGLRSVSLDGVPPIR